jgi:penicillin-binding protein 2
VDIKQLQHRLYIFTWIVISVFVFLTAGLTALQIVKGDEYEKLAQENRIRIIPITAPRGVFRDRYGRELVNNRPSFTVSYMNVNSDSKEQDEVFRTLSEILDIPLYTDIIDEKHIINEKGELYLNQVPIVDLNHDGKLGIEDLKVVQEKTGEKVTPLKVDGGSGKVKLSLEKGTSVLVTYRYDNFKYKIRDQGYKKYMPVRLKTDLDFGTIARIEEQRLGFCE